jgi:elongation factor G
MITDRLGAQPIVMQLPIGAEADFKGVVDLVRMKALVWSAEATKGEMYDIVDIPATHTEAAEEYRGKLIEGVAERERGDKAELWSPSRRYVRAQHQRQIQISRR